MYNFFFFLQRLKKKKKITITNKFNDQRFSYNNKLAFEAAAFFFFKTMIP